jgi:hypothetical protein
MTYTFKLARRLAVSRKFTMLPVLLLFAACNGGDATAPDGSPAESPTAGTDWSPDITPVAVRITPSSVTLETNQLIHFRAYGRTSAGDSVDAAVTWRTTGGTILPDGRYSAAAIGTYAVIGRNYVRGGVQFDTSIVVVVRRQTNLSSVEVTPASTSLTPGVSQTFTAVGHLLNGETVPIGVNWSASGGTVDAGGTYVPGDTAGTYQVIATNTGGTYADTATVSISAPPSPPPPAPAPPPPPALQKITLVPSSVTLAPSVTKQFAAYGQTTAGDSVAVSVVFNATGGTMSSGGLYTAGASTGTFRVIANAGALADTSTVIVSLPAGSGSTTGIPFGPFALMQGATWRYGRGPSSFTLNLSAVEPAVMPQTIAVARDAGVRLVLAMTGGSHSQYLTNAKFDLAKWKSRQKLFDTPANKEAVAAGVADGTIVAASVMDEPHHSSWGGVPTKAMIDEMSAFTKAIFPTLPTASVVPWSWNPSTTYKHLDLIISQYREREPGDLLSYQAGAIAAAKANKTGLMFSMNVLDWSVPATTGDPCPIPQTGGPGTQGDLGVKSCRITAAVLERDGLALGLTPQSCGLLMWKFDTLMFDQTAYKNAVSKIRTAVQGRPSASCRRTP